MVGNILVSALNARIWRLIIASSIALVASALPASAYCNVAQGCVSAPTAPLVVPNFRVPQPVPQVRPPQPTYVPPPQPTYVPPRVVQPPVPPQAMPQQAVPRVIPQTVPGQGGAYRTNPQPLQAQPYTPQQPRGYIPSQTRPYTPQQQQVASVWSAIVAHMHHQTGVPDQYNSNYILAEQRTNAGTAQKTPEHVQRALDAMLSTPGESTPKPQGWRGVLCWLLRDC
jgi:hypothetical protein